MRMSNEWVEQLIPLVLVAAAVGVIVVAITYAYISMVRHIASPVVITSTPQATCQK